MSASTGSVPGRPARYRRARPGALVVAALLLLLATLAGSALANGGTVRISMAPVGPWFVTVYSSPTPLRTGDVDISTLVQDSTDEMVDVPVTVDATAIDVQAEAVHAAATRAQATNKLFKAAKFEIAVPGTWEFRVRVSDPTGPGGTVLFRATVVKSTILDRPFLLATLIVLPLLVLGWFLLGRGEEEDERRKGRARG